MFYSRPLCILMRQYVAFICICICALLGFSREVIIYVGVEWPSTRCRCIRSWMPYWIIGYDLTLPDAVCMWSVASVVAAACASKFFFFIVKGKIYHCLFFDYTHGPCASWSSIFLLMYCNIYCLLWHIFTHAHKHSSCADLDLQYEGGFESLTLKFRLFFIFYLGCSKLNLKNKSNQFSYF